VGYNGRPVYTNNRHGHINGLNGQGHISDSHMERATHIEKHKQSHANSRRTGQANHTNTSSSNSLHSGNAKRHFSAAILDERRQRDTSSTSLPSSAVVSPDIRALQLTTGYQQDRRFSHPMLSPLESQPTRNPLANNHLPTTDLDHVFANVFRRLALERSKLDGRRLSISVEPTEKETSADMEKADQNDALARKKTHVMDDDQLPLTRTRSSSEEAPRRSSIFAYMRSLWQPRESFSAADRSEQTTPSTLVLTPPLSSTPDLSLSSSTLELPQSSLVADNGISPFTSDMSTPIYGSLPRNHHFCDGAQSSDGEDDQHNTITITFTPADEYDVSSSRSRRGSVRHRRAQSMAPELLVDSKRSEDGDAPAAPEEAKLMDLKDALLSGLADIQLEQRPALTPAASPETHSPKRLHQRSRSMSNVPRDMLASPRVPPAGTNTSGLSGEKFSTSSLSRRSPSLGLNIEPVSADVSTTKATATPQVVMSKPSRNSLAGIMSSLTTSQASNSAARRNSKSRMTLRKLANSADTAIARSLLFKACLMHEYGLTLRAVLGRPPIGENDMPTFMNHDAADLVLLRHFMQPGSLSSIVGGMRYADTSIAMSPASSKFNADTTSTLGRVQESTWSTLGSQYERTPHRRMATRLLELSALPELGCYPLACYCYAMLLLHGYGCDQDLSSARELLERAANADEPLAMYELARSTLFSMKPQERQQWLRCAAKHPQYPSADACYDLAQLHYDPDSTAIRHYITAQSAPLPATSPHTAIPHRRSLGHIYASNQQQAGEPSLKKDKKKAAKYFRRCVALGKTLPDTHTRWIFKRKYM
jgi:hypothetical protein